MAVEASGGGAGLEAKAHELLGKLGPSEFAAVVQLLTITDGSLSQHRFLA
jgi:hypothetical protein